MAYIRDYYGVPAKRGGRVVYTGAGRREFGTICGTSSARLRIRLDGMKHSMPFHPTWMLRYLPAQRERHNDIGCAAPKASERTAS